jgi:hypothetical protein
MGHYLIATVYIIATPVNVAKASCFQMIKIVVIVFAAKYVLDRHAHVFAVRVVVCDAAVMYVLIVGRVIVHN